MTRAYGFEPGERYVLDGVGYEIVHELNGEEVVVRNLFSQRKQSERRQQLREYWHEGRLWFGIRSGGKGEGEVEDRESANALASGGFELCVGRGARGNMGSVPCVGTVAGGIWWWQGARGTDCESDPSVC